MKKYIYAFFMTIFATASLTLISCSKDDDNNGDNASSQLTINGSKHSFELWSSRIFMRYDNRNAFECDLRDDNGKHLSFTIYDWDTVADGHTYSGASDIAVWWDDSDDDACGDMNYNISSGNIKITSIDKASKRITLSFNNAVFSCDIHNASFTLNGSIAIDYN